MPNPRHPNPQIHANFAYLLFAVVSLGAQPWYASLLLDASFFYADQPGPGATKLLLSQF